MTSSKQTTLPTNLHPCSLDLNSPASRRKAQKRVAQRVAQRRMMKHNANECAQDGSNVVYRTGIQYGDYEGLTSYTKVEFLNNHDIIVVGCQDSCCDIVKLPPYQATDNQQQKRRPMGKLLATKVSCANTSSRPVQCIKSLEGGKSFAVGHAGEYVVYATEHASFSKDCAKSTPAVQQRLQDTQALELKCQRFECRCGNVCGEDYTRYTVSVEVMLRSFGLQRNNSLTFVDISHYPGQPSAIFANPRWESTWDFRETPSTLMASFLEREMNCFSLSILDGRISQSACEPVACVGDKALNEFNPAVGHVASTCFISDHCLATLHMWQRPCQKSSSTVVKLWDIRKTARGKSSPAAERILSPSLYDAAGNVTTDLTMDLDNQVSWENSPAQAQLVPSVDDNGQVMASIVTNSGVAESYLLDASRGSVVKQYRTRSAVQSTNAIAPTLDCLACYDSSSLSLYDFSEQDWQQKRASSGGGTRKTRGKKRSQDDLDSSNGENLNEVCLIGIIAPIIEDEVGIRARLSCMAFNKTGTSLVGGTDTGDLFLWRGG